jgi:predicted ATP-binding protein involved in virulence
MKLTKVEITNFRCFESLTVPLQPDINVLVGVNGAGKTAILDAVAIALYDVVAANGGGGKRQRAAQGVILKPTDIHIAPGATEAVTGRRDFVQIKAQAGDYYALPDFPSTTPSGGRRFIEWTDSISYSPPNNFTYDANKSERPNDIGRYSAGLWNQIRRSDHRARIPLPVVAYYRSNRSLSRMPEMGDIFALRLERNDAFLNALNAGANYQAMCQWFYLRENQELRERLQLRDDLDFAFSDLKAIRDALKRSLENVNRVFFTDSPPSLEIEFADTGKGLRVFKLEQLSDGYRNLLAVVLDFAHRLAQAHPNWDNPLEAPGILLIDEIELHLHPQWQQRIIPNLRTVFPNTQLIVATHSPQVLTTVEQEKILILKDHCLHTPAVSTYGAESARLLTEVLQTKLRPENEVVDQFQKLFELIGQDHLQEAWALSEELIRSRNADDPALIEAQTIIKNRQWEKELGL